MDARNLHFHLNAEFNTVFRSDSLVGFFENPLIMTNKDTMRGKRIQAALSVPILETLLKLSIPK